MFVCFLFLNFKLIYLRQFADLTGIFFWALARDTWDFEPLHCLIKNYSLPECQLEIIHFIFEPIQIVYNHDIFRKTSHLCLLTKSSLYFKESQPNIFDKFNFFFFCYDFLSVKWHLFRTRQKTKQKQRDHLAKEINILLGSL